MQLRRKPWLSRALVKSIKHKNKLFKNLHKKFYHRKFDDYKKYRNILNRAIKYAKESYHKDRIETSRGDSKSLWNVICELANLKNNKKSITQQYSLRQQCC